MISDDEKKYAKVYVKPDGTIFRLGKIVKMVKKFEDMNWLEQQSFLSSLSSKMKPKPSKEHSYHFFISKRGKPHNE